MKKGIMMKKSTKIVIGVCAALFCLVAGVTVFFLWVNGVFDPPPAVTDVASFKSPDGAVTVTLCAEEKSDRSFVLRAR